MYENSSKSRKEEQVIIFDVWNSLFESISQPKMDSCSRVYVIVLFHKYFSNEKIVVWNALIKGCQSNNIDSDNYKLSFIRMSGTCYEK